MKRDAEMILFVDGCHGIYVPVQFAKRIRRECIFNVTPADLDELQKGPDEEGYWDLWTEIMDAAEVLNPETGTRYRVYQDGDCWLIEKGAEFDDALDAWIIEDGEPDMDGK